MRQCPKHLHGRIDGRLHPARQADRHTERHADEPAQQQTLGDPHARNPQCVSEFAVADQLQAGVGNQ